MIKWVTLLTIFLYPHRREDKNSVTPFFSYSCFGENLNALPEFSLATSVWVQRKFVQYNWVTSLKNLRVSDARVSHVRVNTAAPLPRGALRDEQEDELIDF